MFSKILVGYNGPAQGHDALELAGRLAAATGASVLVGYVYQQQPRFYATTRQYLRDQRAATHAMLEPALSALPAEVSARTAAISSSSPARGLYDLAAEERADLVVIGSTHRGPVGRVLIGTVGELLLAAAPSAVAVAPKGISEQAGPRLGVVGAGYDGSPESAHAVAAASVLAASMEARLRVLTAVEHLHLPHGQHEPEQHGHPSREELQSELTDAVRKIARTGDADHIFLEGSATDALAEAAAETDIMVVGSRGYGPVRHALLGSVSARLMRSSASPLLVVPRGEDVAGAGAGQTSSTTRA